jgi:hypothetical protein
MDCRANSAPTYRLARRIAIEPILKIINRIHSLVSSLLSWSAVDDGHVPLVVALASQVQRLVDGADGLGVAALSDVVEAGHGDGARAGASRPLRPRRLNPQMNGRDLTRSKLWCGQRQEVQNVPKKHRTRSVEDSESCSKTPPCGATEHSPKTSRCQLERYTELSAKNIQEIVSFKLALVGLKGFEDY